MSSTLLMLTAANLCLAPIFPMPFIVPPLVFGGL